MRRGLKHALERCALRCEGTARDRESWAEFIKRLERGLPAPVKETLGYEGRIVDGTGQLFLENGRPSSFFGPASQPGIHNTISRETVQGFLDREWGMQTLTADEQKEREFLKRQRREEYARRKTRKKERAPSKGYSSSAVVQWILDHEEMNPSLEDVMDGTGAPKSFLCALEEMDVIAIFADCVVVCEEP